MKFSSILIFSSFLISVSHAETLIVTLDSVARRVRAQNPELAAARLGIRQAAGKHLQAGRLDNPALETSFQHDARFREKVLQLGVTQKFPVTKRLTAEKQATAAMVKAAEAEVLDIERKLIANAQETTVKILALREQRELRQRQHAVMDGFATFIRDAANKGEMSSIDAGQAKLEATRLNIAVRQLDAQETEALGALKYLLGVRLDESLQVSGRLPELRGTLPATSRTRPDLLAAYAQTEAANHEVVAEHGKRYEDVEAGVFASSSREEDAPNGFSNETMVGFQLRLPLPLWQRNEGNIAAAEAVRKRRELETKAVRQAIRIESATAHAEMRQWRKLIDELNDELLPLARKQSTDAETAFRNGQGELQAVLRSRDQSIELESSRIDALRDFHLARIRYASSIGCADGY